MYLHDFNIFLVSFNFFSVVYKCHIKLYLHFLSNTLAKKNKKKHFPFFIIHKTNEKKLLKKIM